MFWLFVGLSLVLLAFLPLVPFFTFGEDYIMVKELGFDTIMLAATLFGVIAAATSVTEEIEGRTAITLMSKPVSRRQFILGKFVGLLFCCLMLMGYLGWFFVHMLIYKRWYDKLPATELQPFLGSFINSLQLPLEGQHLVAGVLKMLQDTFEVMPGLVTSASLVMILLAVSISLATRLPMIVNLVVCLVVYMLANLMPVLVQTTRPRGGPGSTVQKLLHFVAQLFDTFLPGLELFRIRPTVVDETTLPMGEYLEHVGAVTVYGVLFTIVVLLLGLVLFEDRDLA
jgi:ABC-type transport system involved in multi-copper enzyme maturation permease subunit